MGSTISTPSHPTTTKSCHLLALPLELQLSIYELVVIYETPLLLNCPCDSSYRLRWHELPDEEAAWKAGTKHPPLQPALTRTCRAIRAVTLPIFYGENVFRACYCNEMLPAPIKWLRMIGTENRELLRHLYFYDRNQDHDRNRPTDLMKVKSSEVFTKMMGKMEKFSGDDCCAHLVTFGDEKWRGKGPIAVLDPKRLRMPAEH